MAILGKKTGTQLIEGVIGQFESLQEKLNQGVALVEAEIIKNEEIIAAKTAANEGLSKDKERALKVRENLAALIS